MDKIILNDNTSLDFSSISSNGGGLTIIFTGQTIDSLESVMTIGNLTKLQIAKDSGETYGIYNNLECISITKNLEDSTITTTLSKLDDTQVKLDAMQQTIDTLVATTLGV